MCSTVAETRETSLQRQGGRRELAGVGLLLLACESQGLNTGTQVIKLGRNTFTRCAIPTKAYSFD